MDDFLSLPTRYVTATPAATPSKVPSNALLSLEGAGSEVCVLIVIRMRSGPSAASSSSFLDVATALGYDAVDMVRSLQVAVILLPSRSEIVAVYVPCSQSFKTGLDRTDPPARGAASAKLSMAAPEGAVKDMLALVELSWLCGFSIQEGL